MVVKGVDFRNAGDDMVKNEIPKSKLETLKHRAAEIQARITEIERQTKAQLRKEDTRLKVIVGAACLADSIMYGETKALLRGILEKAVKAPRDREFLKSKGWL